MNVKKKFSKKLLIFIISIVIVISCIGGKLIYDSWSHETTDDAYVDGNIIPLRTTVTGYIDNILFTDNQKITRGDTLIIFDTANLKSQIEQAEAQVMYAQAELQSSKKQISASEFNEIAASFNAESAKESATIAKAHEWQAEKEYRRIEKMYKAGAATQQTYDNTKANYLMANAQMRASYKQFDAMVTQKSTIRSQTNIHCIQVKQALAHIKQAKAQLASAKDQYKHAFVTAPCNGIISKRSIERGQFVSSGTALASLINLSNIWITANFKETQLDDIKTGQPVRIKIDAYPELNLKGMVESFCGATSNKFSLLPTENVTGNFIKITQRISVHIRLAILNEQKPLLLPGMNAVVSVKTK